MPEKSFESTVIFFGLISYPALFQIMINEILQNLINTGEIASFIDNVIVETKEEERYNEIIKEVIKKLVENNLYI